MELERGVHKSGLGWRLPTAGPLEHAALAAEKVCHFAVQASRQRKHRLDADVAFSAFYAADIIPMQLRPVRQLLLAELARKPKLPHGLTEGEKVRIGFHLLDLRLSAAVIYTLSV